MVDSKVHSTSSTNALDIYMPETDTYPKYFKYTTYMIYSMEKKPCQPIKNESVFQNVQEFIINSKLFV